MDKQMIRIVLIGKSDVDPFLRTTVFATRARAHDVSYVHRLMRQAAEKHLLPGFRVVNDGSLIGGYFIDDEGDCVVAENVVS